MSSPLSNFIRWLYFRALAEGRIPEFNEESIAFMSGMADFACVYAEKHAEEYRAGLEIHDGRPHSDLARRIQRRAIAETHDQGLVLLNIDEVGYTPINIRSLLSHHYWDLRRAPLGSDAWCAYIDVTTAINKASDRARAVAWLLIAGVGPQEAGQLLSTNGSRAINRALRELTRILGGHYAAKETR